MSIVFDQCSKRYGKHTALDSVSFSVKEGEIFGFLGPNGAGKSTSIRILLGLIRPSAGKASVCGLDVIKDSLEIRRRIGYLPGEISFPLTMTAEEVVNLTLSIHGKSREKARMLFDRFSLDPHKRIKDMSKGMKQKTAIVNAFCHDPAVLILDEPTSGLDPLMQSTFNELLIEEKKQGKTIFMSSHILSDVEHICDRVGMIQRGILHHVGTLEEVSHSFPYSISMQASEGCLEEIKQTCDISDVTFDGRTYQFRLRPPFGTLFSIWAKHKVERATVTPPSLEEVFHGFYRGGDRP